MAEMVISIKRSTLIALMLVILLVFIGINQYLIFSINSALSKGVSISGRIVEKTPQITTQTEPTGEQASSDIVQQIYDEVVPKEGAQTDYGITFSNEGLQTLVGHQRSISLSGEDQQRYIKIGTSPDTACEYCCGIGERGALRDDGNIACGCAHNIALAGLIKYLIQQGYTDEQILDEIQKWKAYFFPRGYVTEVLQERGISPESVGLPTQRGGC
jgi:hypothetical protein